MADNKKLKRPLLLLAGIMAIASVFLSLWSLNITGEIEIDDEPLGQAYGNVTVSHFNVNVSLKFIVGDENATSYTTIQYTNLNYSANTTEWIFTSVEDTVPADTMTRYIYPVLPVTSIISGACLILLAFTNIKEKRKWLAIILIMLAIIPTLYFWYSWNTYLGHANLSFFNESGTLLDLPTGVAVSGNPALGFWLLLFSSILSVIFIAIPYYKKTLFN